MEKNITNGELTISQMTNEGKVEITYTLYNLPKHEQFDGENLSFFTNYKLENWEFKECNFIGVIEKTGKTSEVEDGYGFDTYEFDKILDSIKLLLNKGDDNE